MKGNANWCEKTKRTDRARTYSSYGLRRVVCIQHGIKKRLRVTKLLHILDEGKTPCNTGVAVKSFPPRTHWGILLRPS